MLICISVFAFGMLNVSAYTGTKYGDHIYYEGTTAQWQKQYGGYNLGIDISGVTVHCAGDNRPADSCGKELTWSLSEDGVFTITGMGKMYDYEENDTPWEVIKKKKQRTYHRRWRNKSGSIFV